MNEFVRVNGGPTVNFIMEQYAASYLYKGNNGTVSNVPFSHPLLVWGICESLTEVISLCNCRL